MRDLIQPTLKIVARTGLFLSVLAWVVSQWWTVECDSPRHVVTVQDYGYSAGVWKFSTITRPSIDVHRSDWMNGYWPLRRKIRLGQREWQSVIPGIVRAGGGNTRRTMHSFFIAIRHWLIVTIFAAFYAALKFFYRKRPEPQPCAV